MILSGKGEIINDSIFAGRYEVVRTLQVSKAGCVYLVRHKQLKSLRVMKVIDRDEGSRQAASEAELLQDLKHPGIPVLFDFAEEGHTVYIVEEYVRGQSLTEYLLYHQLSQLQIVSMAIRLCDILGYLHGRKPYPILYQDMKPDHIFIEGDRIRLVDYGIAHFLNHSGENPCIYGTRSYASPEQMAGTMPDERSDLYSLALVIRELSNHASEPVSYPLKKLIAHGLAEKPENRPATVELWKEDWVRLQTAMERTGESERDHQKTVIAVVGSDRGVGTTHVAVSLTVWLNRCKRQACYYSKDGRASAKRMRCNSPAFQKKDAFIYHPGFAAALCDEPDPGSPPDKPPFSIAVLDCGTEDQAAVHADTILYVVGSSLWKSVELKKSLLDHRNVILLINPSSRGAGLSVSHGYGRKTRLFPLDTDPFSVSKAKAKVFRSMFPPGAEA